MRSSFKLTLLGWAVGCGEQKLTAFNAEPDVEITSHDDDDSINEGVVEPMLAAVDDADDPEAELVATWSAGDTVICDAIPVSDAGLTACDVTVGADEGTITVIVQDPGGSTGADSVRLNVEVTSAPQIEIVSPVNDEDARYYEGTAFDVLAMASVLDDAASDDLTRLSVSWSLQNAETGSTEPLPDGLAMIPDDDGSVGGQLILSEGAYRISVDVTDITGKESSDSQLFDVRGPNQNPQCLWTAPADGAVFVHGEPMTLEGFVEDSDWAGEANRLSVSWFTDQVDSGTVEAGKLGDSVPESGGEVRLSLDDLDVGAHILSLVVTDELGASCSVDRNVVVTSAPESTLIRPQGEVLYYVDHPVALEGTVVDDDSVFDALSATWNSSMDGALDVSTDLDTEGRTTGSVMLSEGAHTMSLTGTDVYGVTGTATSTIVVRGPNQPPSCAIVTPTSGDGGAVGVMTTFSGAVDDADIGPEALAVAWESDVDGPLTESIPGSDGVVTMSTGELSIATHTITLTVTDERGASCTDNIVFVVGLPPVVSITSPVDGSVSNVGSVVTFLGSVADPDEEESSLSVVWSSDRDGVIYTGSPDSTGQTLTTSSSLTAGDHAITLTATDALGLTATAITVFRVNSMPTSPTVRISPDPATTTDDLTVVFDVDSVDLDLDPVAYRFEWFKGGDLMVESGTLEAVSTSKHDTWTVRVTPYDPFGDGVSTTASRTIQNTPPTLLSVEIGPEEVFTNTHVESSVLFDDVDGDVVTLEHSWTVNSVSAGDAAGLLDGTDWFDKHDVIELSVTVADEDDIGPSMDASAVVVQNSPPSAATIRVSPDDAIGGMDPLVCEIETPGTDLDGDPILYTLSWERDGDAYPDTESDDTGASWVGPITDEWTDDTVPAVDTVPEETWECTVTSWDDEEAGGVAVDAVLVSAPPPGCGDGLLQAGEEFDPPPGPFLNVSVDAETCRWDFSDVEQLYCYGFCSWAGPPGCDDADADVLCKLITDNPDSEAITYTVTAPLSAPGFPGVYCGYGELIDTDRGIPDVAWMDESMAAHHGGGGQVVAFPDCTDP